jgi:hypothetical protein
MNQSEIADILEALAKAIRSADSSQLTAIRRRIAGLRSATKAPSSKGRGGTAPKIDRKRVTSTHKRLVAARSREEGLNLLQTESLSRVELVALAREGNVHVTKEDGVNRIEEKLVEALIGSRLSSEAIRGN